MPRTIGQNHGVAFVTVLVAYKSLDSWLLQKETRKKHIHFFPTPRNENIHCLGLPGVIFAVIREVSSLHLLKYQVSGVLGTLRNVCLLVRCPLELGGQVLGN